jgi:DNA-binding response OmpR family regulator
MIKQLRQINNLNLLCVTKDNNLNTKVQSELSSCKTITILSNVEDITADELKCDFIILDYSFTQAHELVESIKKSKKYLPMIILVEDDSDDVILRCLNMGAYSILSKDLNFLNLKLSMIMALNQSKRTDKINFQNGIYYDIYRERFYHNQDEIKFTNYEFQVLKLLLDNKGESITYEYIKEMVWKEKKMSIFTMRNIINKIRKKTYYEIIKNNSSRGYQIDTIKN